MNFFEFKDLKKLDYKAYILNGDEDLFKLLSKNKIVSHNLDYDFVYVDSDLEISDFYSNIESSDLFSSPKIFYVNNINGGLSKQKQFWNYVSNSTDNCIYIVNYLKEKIPETVNYLEIKCEKIKDSQKEVSKITSELAKEIEIVVSPTDLPIFYAFYKNNLFSIYQELKKCKIYANANKTSYLDTKEILKIISPSLEKDPFLFANNFMQRKLKICLANLPKDSDFIPQFGNIFNIADKLLVYKSCKSLKLNDEKISKDYDINLFYLKYNLIPIEKIWDATELNQLMLEIENINYKIRRFNFTVNEAILNLVLKYCR